MENVNTVREQLVPDNLPDNEKDDLKDERFNKYTINVNTKIQQFVKNNKLLTNKICTSKYTFLNCFPKILWEQFSKVGNIYFLFLAILQVINYFNNLDASSYISNRWYANDATSIIICCFCKWSERLL